MASNSHCVPIHACMHVRVRVHELSLSSQDEVATHIKFQHKIEPASIAEHQLFCRSTLRSSQAPPCICTTDANHRKGGRVMTVVRDAELTTDKLNVRLLCVPPHLLSFRATGVGDANSQAFDVSLLYRMILYVPWLQSTAAFVTRMHLIDFTGRAKKGKLHLQNWSSHDALTVGLNKTSSDFAAQSSTRSRWCEAPDAQSGSSIPLLPKTPCFPTSTPIIWS